MVKSISKVVFLLFVSCLCYGNFRAYNDCIRGAGDTTAANVTNWTVYDGFASSMSGLLVDYDTGQQTPVTATFTWNSSAGLNVSETSGSSDGVSQPRPGTPAHEVFGGIVDFSGRVIYYGSSGWWTQITFTGLDPNKNYSFSTTAIRARDYPDRLTQFTLSGHTSAINTSSDGIYLKNGSQTVLVAGGNHLNTTGYVARWDEIRVADRGDGTGQFSVRANAYGSNYKAYPFGGFLLEETGNNAPTVSAGDDQAIYSPAAYATLSGTLSDDGFGGTTLESTWSQVSGPATVEFVGDIHQSQVQVRFPAEGSYQLRLFATDGELSASDDVTVTVHPSLCPVGDINGDCMTTLADLKLLALDWLDESDAAADLTGDQQADLEELILIAQSWLEDWTGSLQVWIGPAEAIAAGAQWRVDEGPWQSSGDVVSSLAEGTHLLEYAYASQWLRPDSSEVIIERQETTVVNTAYTQPSEFVTISEFMAVNSNTSDLRPVPSGSISTVVDEQFVYEDWIELHNMTDDPIDMGGWYLTDDPDDLTKWQIPADSILHARGYAHVFASGKDPEKYGYPFWDDQNRLHTNFKLASDGEFLALVRPDGQTIEHAYDIYPKQRGLVSYGIGSDGRIGYLTGVSFCKSNTPTYDGVVEDTSFSVGRGFYDAPVTVQIMCSTPDAVIRYTTDNSEPTETHGTVYDPAMPIVISNTTCLRAAAFKSGWLPSNVDTQTYLFLDDVLVQATHPATGAQVVPPGYPTTWPGSPYGGAVVGDYQVDPDIASPTGMFGDLYAATLKDDLKDIPSISLVVPTEQFFAPITGIYTNYDQDGTERAGSMEFIDPTGAERFHTNCGVRMQGGANHDGGGTTLNRWKCFKLSMRLTFRGLYGGTLEYPVFGEGAACAYDTLVLDSRPQNSWVHGDGTQRTRGEYLRDQASSDTQLAMGGYACHGRPVHLYLNGLYWGLYWLHERPDDAFAASYLGGDKEDYDVIKHDYGNIISGSNDDYVAMFGISTTWPDPVTAFQNLQAKLDVADFMDYLLANYYLGNGDWDHKNWYASRNRFDPAGRWRWHMWDGEHVMDDGTIATTDATTKNTGMGPTGLHQRWVANAEYRMLFADRVQKHFFGDGALTTSRFMEMFTGLAMQISRAVVGESARWGDNRRSTPYTRDAEWLTEINRLSSDFISTRREVVLSQFTGKSPAWYPPVFATTFYVDGQPQHGGDVPCGSLLTLTTGGVLVGYTLDGCDLRLPGGAVSPSAVQYTTPLPLTKSVTVKSRSLVNKVWGALVEATYNVGPVKESIRISELMYHPVDGELEFVELTNVGAESVNLNLVQFTDGITHTFGDVSVTPGGFVLLVRNKALFEAHYTSLPAGVEVIEWADGALNNAGETLTLVDALGRTIQSFTYDDKWYPMTDGDGFSLTVRDACDPDPAAWDRKTGWRLSSVTDGTPGVDDAQIAPDTIVINEILAHSHSTLPDWIELYNTTPQAISIGGWFLSDSSSDLMKYEIPDGTVVPGYGYIVFNEDQHFGSVFAFSDDGETAYLTSGEAGQLTGYQVSQSFGATATAISVGRYLTSTGDADFVNLSQATPGLANAYPLVGPVVITEIHYHPGDTDTGDEYLELYNISGQAVTLQDLVETEISPGVYSDQLVSWSFSEGIDYTFPAGTQIPAGGFIIIAKNPTAFNACYAGTVPAGTPVLGPFAGGTSLSNGGETLQLSRPGEQAYGDDRAWICVEQITYDDASPWPTEPDGDGKTLKRIFPGLYGSDPVNWIADDPSPGIL